MSLLPISQPPSFSDASKKLPTLTSISTFVSSVLTRILRHSESRNIFLFLCLNLAFMTVEMSYGVWTNSLGLISDACHMLFDCTALGIGLFASLVSKWNPDDIYTYGYGRVQVLSGFINAIFLIFISLSVFTESVVRLINPPEIRELDQLLIVAVIGLCVNLVGIFAFSDAHNLSHESGHGHSHAGGGHGHSHGKSRDIEGEDEATNDNMNAIFWHVMADTLGSVAVILSSILVKVFDWKIADPICSFCLSVLIFIGATPLLKKTALTLMLRTPTEKEKSVAIVIQKISEIPFVIRIPDVHFWSQDNNTIVGTIRIVADFESSMTSQGEAIDIHKIQTDRHHAILAKTKEEVERRIPGVVLAVQIEKEGVGSKEMF
eukprot:TRINITY_DN440_c0_g1_i1.p1 TRINITY_DN440_c0_g1~~TRINITY_DN440_c0_g1_i1.p1  ORF type:complete len:376 (+),score=129.00 TRINITY_DN440_c0_g1_i1:508-1635(+)